MTTDARANLSHDLLRQERQPLDVFFVHPTVVVVGATETADSVGRTILWNLGFTVRAEAGDAEVTAEIRLGA